MLSGAKNLSSHSGILRSTQNDMSELACHSERSENL